MTTTNFSLCIFCLCLLTSCSKGEKKTNELVRVKVAEVEMLVPSAEREFSFIAKPFKETELSFRAEWKMAGRQYCGQKIYMDPMITGLSCTREIQILMGLIREDI